MDAIPFIKFFGGLVIFGIMLYLYNPIIEYLNEEFPTAGIYSAGMFFLWAILPMVVLFFLGVRLVMEIQRHAG